MTEIIINDTPKLRTLETRCKICLGVRFGIELMYEHASICYLPFDDQGELRPDRGYYADLTDGVWLLTDSRQTLKRTFPDRSAMTKWVKRNINLV